MKRKYITRFSLAALIAVQSILAPFGVSSLHAYSADDYTGWQNITPQGTDASQLAHANFPSYQTLKSDGASSLYLFDSNYKTIYFSTNNGSTWGVVPLPNEITYLDRDRSAVANNGIILLHGYREEGDVYYLSKNYGSTWQVIAPGAYPRAPQSPNLALSHDGQTIVISDVNPLGYLAPYLSRDGGSTWNELIPPTADPDQWAWGLNSLSGDGTTVALVGLNSTIGVHSLFISHDKGLTWQVAMTTPTDTEAPVIQTNGGASSNNGTTLAITLLDDFAGHFVTSLSHDGGLTWQVQSNVLSGGDIAMSDDGQVIVTNGNSNQYVSWNGGENWQILTTNTNMYFAPQARNDGIIYRNTTNDTNLIWHKESSQPTSFAPLGGLRLGETATSSNGSVIVTLADTAYGQGKQVLISNNYGNSWTNVTPADALFTDDTAVSLSSNGASIILSTNSGGHQAIVVSKNKGVTWQTIIPPLQNSLYDEVSFSADGTTYLWGVGVDGDPMFYYSLTRDNGTHWEAIQLPGITPEQTLYNPVISGDGSIIIASVIDYTTGAFSDPAISRDGGVSWQRIPLPRIDPLGDEAFYIAKNNIDLFIRSWSESGGVQFYHLAPTSSLTPTNITPQDIEPSSSDWTVYTSGNGSTVILQAYDGTTYISRDKGVTFTTLSPQATGIASFASFEISQDGSVLIAQGMDEDWQPIIKVSYDSATTWQDPPLATATSFSELFTTIPSISLSSDGTSLYVLSNEGYLYRSILTSIEPNENQPPLTPTVSISDSHSQGSTTPTATNPNSPQRITTTQPTFSGIATPGSHINVTVHSDPITCTTVAAQDGSWSCTLPSAIPPGVHTLIVTVTDADTGEITTLGPFYLEIASGSGQTTVTNQTANPTAPNTGIEQLLLQALPHSGTSSRTPGSATIPSISIAVVAITLLGILGWALVRTASRR